MKRWTLPYKILVFITISISTACIWYLETHTTTPRGEVIALAVGLIALFISIIQMAENNKLFVDLDVQLKVWIKPDESIDIDGNKHHKVVLKITNLHKIHISYPRMDLRVPDLGIKQF